MSNHVINGKYEIIPISHFGYSIEDIGLEKYDMLCWDPRMYIDDNCKINIFNVAKKNVECTVKAMDYKKHNSYLEHLMPNPAMSFMMILTMLRSMSMYPFFICSDEVANTLGLDTDGDTIYIKEVIDENKDSNY